MSLLFFPFLLCVIIAMAVLFLQIRNKLKFEPMVIYITLSILSIIWIGIIVWFDSQHTNYSTEILNGTVTNKTREHGSFTESYDCHCKTVSYSDKGKRKSKRSCDTCHQTWYTVKWKCDTTIGAIPVASKKSKFQTVYATPNPPIYDNIVIGDPAAKTHSYVNYVSAANESLYKTQMKQIPPNIKIPPYPTIVYNLYKVDRFYSDIDLANRQAWIDMVANLNKEVGAVKQANIIIVVTKEPAYYADLLNASWNGVNKNDIVVVIGTASEAEPISWVRVLSWTKREDFKLGVRDKLMDLKSLDINAVHDTIASEVKGSFERRKMEEFSYLSEEQRMPVEYSMIYNIVILLVVGLVAYKAQN